MKRIKQYIDLVFEKLTKLDWDNVIVVCGDEGMSKSNLLEHITDYWYTKLNGKCGAEDVKHICLNREQFAEDLKDCKKFELTAYDEADLISRRSMDTFNVMLMKTYQIVRGDNLFTIFVIPSIFDLDPFFRNRRVRGMFYVHARGRCAFWNKSRLRKTLMLNEGKPIKNIWKVKPLFYDTFPKYKGVLAEGYKAKKEANMKGTRQKFFDEMQGKDKKPKDVTQEKRRERILNAKQSGKTMSEIAEYEGLSKMQLYRILKNGDNNNAVT